MTTTGNIPIGSDGGLLVSGNVGATVGLGGAHAANSANVVTIPAVAGKTTVLKGFVITGTGATLASVVEAYITDGSTFTNYFEIAIPAGLTTSIVPLVVDLGDGIAAGAPNTLIHVGVPAFGAGNTNAAVMAWGGYI